MRSTVSVFGMFEQLLDLFRVATYAAADHMRESASRAANVIL